MKLYGTEISSRLLLGTAQYPSPTTLTDAIRASACDIVTVSLRRETADGSGARFWEILQTTGARILPNTAGCHSAREAIATAQMAREVFGTSWIKLEVIGHADTLQPDVFALVEAATALTKDGFQVFPYMTDDLVVGERLIEAGCEVLMPWGAPIGSGQGLRNPDALAGHAGAFPAGAADRGCRYRPPLRCLPGDGNRHGCGVAEHRRGTGRRSGKDGASDGQRRCRRPRGLSRRSDGTARHGGAVNTRSGPGGALVMERFYLIAGHVGQLELLVPEGVKLVQLRLKNTAEPEIRRQIARARDFCAVHRTQLVVNDHWQAALDLRCGFVHLGQEDMDQADFRALNRAGVKYGLSTHDEAELDRALALDPAYVALGPVYPTLLKEMKWQPQGLSRVTHWKAIAGKTPLVAIGGLTPDRLPGVFAAGADSAAVVTDIQTANDPQARTRDWIRACAS